MLKVNPMATVDEAPGFRRMFRAGRLTLGVFFPIEAFTNDEPSMLDQERLAQRAQALGYAAVWVRDVPLRDPSFGDLGQIHDPWVYLGWIAAHTQTIALATGSIVLPLRHPLHVAKAAASVDQLSGGRLVLGVASGDRPVEFPAFGVDIERRAVLFRDYFEVIRRVLEREYPTLKSTAGVLAANADLVPKPLGRLPMLVTGNSGQPLPWIAAHADGWITYPRGMDRQAEAVARWRAEVHAARPGAFKPFVQSLYVDLADDPDLPPDVRSTSASGPGGTSCCVSSTRCASSASTTSSSTSSTARGRRPRCSKRSARRFCRPWPTCRATSLPAASWNRATPRPTTRSRRSIEAGPTGEHR